MSTEDRKEREKEQRSNQIIDAAEEVILSKGLAQATMTDIAAQAELSKGTVYLYFKNKTELYIAIARRGSKILNKRFAKVFAGDFTGLQIIRKLGDSYLDFVKNNPGYYRAFMHYESLNDVEILRKSEVAKSCEENRKEALGFMVRALQIGMQDGSVDDSYDPRQLAIVIWSSTKGITSMVYMKEVGHHYKVLDEMEFETDRLFESFIKLVGTGIATEQARSNFLTDGH